MQKIASCMGAAFLQASDAGRPSVKRTAAHGRALFLMALSIALLGVGNFLTLLLVIFNRRVALRQFNASFMQLSDQIRQLQGGKS